MFYGPALGDYTRPHHKEFKIWQGLLNLFKTRIFTHRPISWTMRLSTELFIVDGQEEGKGTTKEQNMASLLSEISDSKASKASKLEA